MAVLVAHFFCLGGAVVLRTAETHRTTSDFGGLALEWLTADRMSRLLVTRNFTVLWANDAAASDLAADIGLEVHDGRLIFADAAHHSHMTAMMAAAPTGCHCLPCTDGDGHVIIRFNLVGQTDGGTIFGLTLRRCGAHRSIPTVDLARVFGLTAGEGRVVGKLLDGLTAEDSALNLGIGIETVRSHIRQVYSKLGVRSREALFQRIMPYYF